MAKLVYIGGYGRSGSTLLEYLLTSNPSLVACGEVERHLRRFGRRKICTCGRRAKKCSVWGNFQHRSGRLKNWDHKQLTLAMLEYVSSDYAVMVDSSKTSWGSTFTPFRLSRDLGENFLLVHLVRDPRAVAWSTMKSLRPRQITSKRKFKVRSLSSRARSLRTVGVGPLPISLARCSDFSIPIDTYDCATRLSSVSHLKVSNRFSPGSTSSRPLRSSRTRTGGIATNFTAMQCALRNCCLLSLRKMLPGERRCRKLTVGWLEAYVGRFASDMTTI